MNLLLLITTNGMTSLIIGSVFTAFILFFLYKTVRSEGDVGIGISDSMSGQRYGILYILYVAMIFIDAMVAAALSESTSHSETIFLPRLLLHFLIAGAGAFGAHGIMINIKDLIEVWNAIPFPYNEGKVKKIGYLITRHKKGKDGKLRLIKEQIYSKNKWLWILKESVEVIGSLALAITVPFIMLFLIAKGSGDLDLLLTGIVERSVAVTAENPSGVIYTKYTIWQRLPKLSYITFGSACLFFIHEIFVVFLASMGLTSKSAIISSEEYDSGAKVKEEEEEDEEEEEKPKVHKKTGLGTFSSGGEDDAFF